MLVAAICKVRMVLGYSNTGVMISNPAVSVDVRVFLR
jgi:hypothetical protein